MDEMTMGACCSYIYNTLIYYIHILINLETLISDTIETWGHKQVVDLIWFPGRMSLVNVFNILLDSDQDWNSWNSIALDGSLFNLFMEVLYRTLKRFNWQTSLQTFHPNYRLIGSYRLTCIYLYLTHKDLVAWTWFTSKFFEVSLIAPQAYAFAGYHYTFSAIRWDQHFVEKGHCRRATHDMFV